MISVGGLLCPGGVRSSSRASRASEPWERPIPGQLRLPLERATTLPSLARTPATLRPEGAGRAAAGGLVLCFEDPDIGWRGVARWYGVHLQDRLDGRG